MKLTQLRISNFQCFGEEPTVISLEPMTFLLGPNGAGKSSVLQVLTRLFATLGDDWVITCKSAAYARAAVDAARRILKQLPALDFVAKELEAAPGMNDPRLLRM